METPKVFASYSHDSDAHKEWVLKLCTKLRDNGVDVTLDEWDLSPGEPIHPFMREGITDSDRVLVICTDRYVEKADTLEGGVGYEITIVDTELDRDLRTDKFIPIIRQSTGDSKVPTSLGIRRYIDFRNDQDFEQKFDELLRTIHGDPLNPKPSLGEYSSCKQSFSSEGLNRNFINIPEKVESASDAYNLAIQLARANDIVGWQQLVESIRSNVFNSLAQLRQENLHSENLKNIEQRNETVNKAVDILSPLISIALAGIKSRNEHFNDQTSVFTSLWGISGWNRYFKDEYEIGVPNFLGYVYHSLHGSISLNTNQLLLALDLARLKVPIVRNPQSRHDMVWKITPLMGWSQAIHENCTDNWRYLVNSYERWKWLREVFENESTYHLSLTAYYMALKIHEWATKIASKSQESLNPQYLSVPLDFLFQEHEIIERATSLLLHDSALPELWTYLGVRQDQMRDSWKASIERYSDQILHFYNPSYLEFLSKIPPQYLNFFDVL